MVSVIIPMYNSANTIVKCLSSVINQTYNGEIEILIINDGSQDNSKNIVEKFINEHNHWNIQLINKPNGGVSSARNVGLALARGNFIALLDSDDFWLEEKLEVQMSILDSNTQIDFLGCARNNEVLRIFGNEIISIHKATVKELLVKMFPQTSTAVFKRRLYEEFGGYNENMTHAEDGNLWIRYCANSNFYYLPDSLVITGDGKPNFGHSGLSANLKAMHQGNLFILKDALKNRMISLYLYYCFLGFYKIKHLRRIIITINK